MLAGGLSQDINEILYGERLLALKKNDGGLRSIAIGYKIRILAAKCANMYATNKLAAQLARTQLGVGVPGGAEAAIHALRRYAEKLPKDHISVKLNFSNALNTLRRDEMLDAIWKELPEILNFVHATYNGSTQLQFDEFTITSEEGSQQGDNLSSSDVDQFTIRT